MIGPEEESSHILEVLRGLTVFQSSSFFQNFIEKLKNWRQFLFKKFFSCVQEKSMIFFFLQSYGARLFQIESFYNNSCVYLPAVQVNLCQKHLFLNQLRERPLMTSDFRVGRGV